jgi:lipooligosaccharide transport system permease protein
VRSLTLGIIHWGLLGHVIYFLLMIAIGMGFTTYRLKALFMS